MDSDMHAIGAGAVAALGDLTSRARHACALRGLIQSIRQSGDGLTPKTAYKVISVDEEYSLLQTFGAEVTRQTLIDKTIDELECEFPGGATKTLYFDASIPMNAMQAQIEAAKP